MRHISIVLISFLFSSQYEGKKLICITKEGLKFEDSNEEKKQGGGEGALSFLIISFYALPLDLDLGVVFWSFFTPLTVCLFSCLDPKSLICASPSTWLSIDLIDFFSL